MGVCGGLVLIGAIAGGYLLLSKSEETSPIAAPQQSQAVASGAATDAARMFQPVPLAERENAIAALIMSDTDKDKVRQALTNNTLRISWVTVSDSYDEDGDWVKVTAGGFSQNIRLFKAPLRIAIPYLPGMPVAVSGLIDGGGGGITVAVHTGGSTFGLKALVKGETIMVPTQ